MYGQSPLMPVNFSMDSALATCIFTVLIIAVLMATSLVSILLDWCRESKDLRGYLKTKWQLNLGGRSLILYGRFLYLWVLMSKPWARITAKCIKKHITYKKIVEKPKWCHFSVNAMIKQILCSPRTLGILVSIKNTCLLASWNIQKIFVFGLRSHVMPIWIMFEYWSHLISWFWLRNWTCTDRS